jgi:hypothetical protein
MKVVDILNETYYSDDINFRLKDRYGGGGGGGGSPFIRSLLK